MKFTCCQNIRQYAVVYVISSTKSLLHTQELKSNASLSKRNDKLGCVCLFSSRKFRTQVHASWMHSARIFHTVTSQFCVTSQDKRLGSSQAHFMCIVNHYLTCNCLISVPRIFYLITHICNCAI